MAPDPKLPIDHRQTKKAYASDADFHQRAHREEGCARHRFEPIVVRHDGPGDLYRCRVCCLMVRLPRPPGDGASGRPTDPTNA